METWKAYIITWIVSGELTIGKKDSKNLNVGVISQYFATEIMKDPVFSSSAGREVWEAAINDLLMLKCIVICVDTRVKSKG